jgi:hypothetical protein
MDSQSLFALLLVGQPTLASIGSAELVASRKAIIPHRLRLAYEPAVAKALEHP